MSRSIMFLVCMLSLAAGPLAWAADNTGSENFILDLLLKEALFYRRQQQPVPGCPEIVLQLESTRDAGLRPSPTSGTTMPPRTSRTL